MKIQTYYDKTLRNAIVKDLLRKTPKATLGEDSAGLECYDDYTWCERYSKYRNLYVSNREYWGYSEEQIRSLGSISSESGIENLVGEILREEGKFTTGALTRRTNRLYDRVFKKIFAKNRRGAARGVFTVSDRWTCMGALAAEDLSHAQQLAELMYGSIIEKDNLRLSRYGDLTKEVMLEAINRSEVSPASIETRRAHAKEKFEKELAALDSLQQRGSYAQLLGLQALEELEELDAS